MKLYFPWFVSTISLQWSIGYYPCYLQMERGFLLDEQECSRVSKVSFIFSLHLLMRSKWLNGSCVLHFLLGEEVWCPRDRKNLTQSNLLNRQMIDLLVKENLVFANRRILIYEYTGPTNLARIADGNQIWNLQIHLAWILRVPCRILCNLHRLHT